MDEQALRAKVREVLKAGKVCDLPVTKDAMEFEIQFARDGDNPGLDKFEVHIRCFAAREFERRRDGR
jgi:hypothetical protein